MIVRVVPDLTGLDKQFDYLVPDALASTVQVGTIVRVPLGARRVRGWVVGFDSGDDDAVDPERLKELTAVVSVGPSPELVGLAQWAAWRWAGRVRPMLAAASPPRVVKKVVELSRTQGDAGERGGVVRVAPVGSVLPTVVGAARRGPVLVVCPSVDGAGLLAGGLRGSGLSVAVMPDEWSLAAGGADVVIGARNAVWAPCPGLAAIVVVDEHDEALQEERSPTWHARDVAVERARRASVPCWLVSPIPTLEALAWAGNGLTRPSRVDERAGWPIVEVVDRGREEPGRWSWLTSRLLSIAQDPAQRLVCVTNIRGRARRVSCRACRALAVCDDCGAGLALDRDGWLACARCKVRRPVVCQSCGSTRFAAIGTGATRLRDELAAAVRRPVLEVSSDADLPVDRPDGAVLVGTEAVLHRAHDATTVAFVDFDDELLAPRFRAEEQAMALLVRAARLVGNRQDGGRILVQTQVPHHDVIGAAVHADPQRLVSAESDRRDLLRLPPVCALAAVSGSAAREWLGEGPDVSGPSNGTWLVRAPSWDTLADVLAALGPRPRGVRVEVDPHRI